MKFRSWMRRQRRIVDRTNCWAAQMHILRWHVINPLNAELSPICYLLALLGAHHFLHVSRTASVWYDQNCVIKAQEHSRQRPHGVTTAYPNPTNRRVWISDYLCRFWFCLCFFPPCHHFRHSQTQLLTGGFSLQAVRLIGLRRGDVTEENANEYLLWTFFFLS